MMKQLTILLASFFIAFHAYSQCTPDEGSISEEFGVSPDTFTKSCVNANVNKVLTVAYPDSYYINEGMFSGTFYLDSVELVSVNNVPDGLDYTPKNNTHMLYPEGAKTYSCVLVHGTATTEEVKNIDFTFRVYGYINNPFGGTVNVDEDSTFSVAFTVLPEGDPECVDDPVLSSSINTFEAFEESIDVYPNPVSSNSTLGINLAESSKTTIEVFDILGKSQSEAKTLNLSSGYNDVKLGNIYSSLPSGMYLIKVNIEKTNNTLIKKIYIN